MKNGNALFMLRVVQNADAMIHRILDLSPSFDVLQDQVAYILATSRSTLQRGPIIISIFCLPIGSHGRDALQ